MGELIFLFQAEFLLFALQHFQLDRMSPPVTAGFPSAWNPHLGNSQSWSQWVGIPGLQLQAGTLFYKSHDC